MDEPIGRKHECELLAAFLSAVEDGRGGVRLLEGSGGSGKTTLATWLADLARERGFAVLSGRSWELSQSVPYEPVVSGLGRFLRSLEAADRARYTKGLASLGALIDGLGTDPTVTAPDGSRARLHDSVATLLARVADDRPVMFVLDDLHWTDPASLEVVQFLTQDLPYVRLGLVITLRPGDADMRPDVRALLAPLRRASFSKSLPVGNLDRDDTIEVARRRLPGNVPERVFDLLWARSIGTPLVVQELIEDLMARDVLRHENGGWTLTDDDPPTPQTVTDLIRDRIDRVDAGERQLLEVLAISDEPTVVSVLAEACDSPERDVEERLGRLRRKRLATDVVGDDGAIRWHLDHPITAHVVAAELDIGIRQRLHRLLSEIDADAPLARRARHIMHGGEPRDRVAAARTLARAAGESYERGAPAQAVDYGRAADAFLDRARIEDLDLARLAFDIDLGLGSALVRVLGESDERRRQILDEAVPALERAWELAAALGTTEQLVAFSRLDRAHFLSGSGQHIADRLEPIRASLEAEGDWDGLIEVLFRRFLVAMRDGDSAIGHHMKREVRVAAAHDLGERAMSLVTLMECGPEFDGSEHPSGRSLITAFLQLARRRSLDWDVRYRASLEAFDHALRLAEPELLESASAMARSVEHEVGEPPNWRHPYARAFADLYRDADDDSVDRLLQRRRGDRSTVIEATIRGMICRWQQGPQAGVTLVDELNAGLDSKDPIGTMSAPFARLMAGEGLPSENPDARRAVDIWEHDWLADYPPSNAQSGAFDGAVLLAVAIAGTDAQFDQIASRAQGYAAERGPTTAWLHVARARRSRADREAAEHLVQAADLFADCGWLLPSAERRIEAAERCRDLVDDDSLGASVSHAAARGASWLVERAAALARPIAPDQPPPTSATDSADLLTKREREVVAEVARGLTNREIAQELFISIRTVTSHLDHIYTKLGFSSRDLLRDYAAATAVDGSSSG